MPAGRDYSRQIKFGGAAGLGFFVMALFGVGYLELRSGRISSPEEIVQGLGMPVVGTLPPVPAKARGLTDTGEASLWQSRLMEAVDSIRTFLMHAARTDKSTSSWSPAPASAKARRRWPVSSAASLARAWRKTLLIDGDLRHPATHTLFNLPLEPGFSEVLRGEASPDRRDQADLAEPIVAHAGRAVAMPTPCRPWPRTTSDDVRRGSSSSTSSSSSIPVPVLPVADVAVAGPERGRRRSMPCSATSAGYPPSRPPRDAWPIWTFARWARC